MPFMEITAPDPGDAANILYTITWSDRDPDSSALINLFYISEDFWLNPPINEQVENLSMGDLYRVIGPNNEYALDIPEDSADDFFVWDVRTVEILDFSAPKFRVIGIISDGVREFRAVSPGYLEITNESPYFQFIRPSIDELITERQIVYGANYDISWVAGDPEGRAFFNLFIDEQKLL